MKRLVLIVTAVIGAVVLLWPWWRNHALLLDFCDYGLVMAAAGRMHLGERPYVDFITPIQTLQFLAAGVAERFWGARYLSLTYLNGVFIVASFFGIAALLLKRFGAGFALLIAAAIVTASAGQHTIIWYNAMGVVWLTLAACAAAQLESERRGRILKLLVVLGALWVGGMTKVTYQISALAFAGAFAIRAGWTKQMSWRTTLLTLLGYLVCGVVAPVVTELIYTGATFTEWMQNVVLLSGRTRTGLLGQMATIQFYLHTPHDYYHPLRFTFAGAWGIALLLVIAGVVGYRIALSPENRVRKMVTLGVLIGGAWICGGVLLATNMEISYLAGAAWLALACSIALAFQDSAPRLLPLLYRVPLGIAAVTLLLPAWEAAWKGTRALWGHEPLVRAQMVATADLPQRFGYLQGMQILPSLHDSLLQFAEAEDKLLAQGVSPASFYFVNATEWMVRVVPEAHHPGLPLWLASGTTVVEGNVSDLSRWLKHGEGLSTIFSYDAWDTWYGPLRAILNRHYLESSLGRMRMYERRTVPEPIEFALATDSNVYSQGMKVTTGSVKLQRGHDGKTVFGGDRSHRVDFGFPLYRLTGEMVGEFKTTVAHAKAEAIFRVYARNGDKPPDAIWEERVDLSGSDRTFERKFAVSTGGRPVTLSMELPAGFEGLAGWRALRSEQAGPLRPEGVGPMDKRLLLKHLDEPLLQALFSDRSNVTSVQAFGRSFQLDASAGAPAWLATEDASEIWFRTDHASQVAGEFKLPEAGWAKGGVRVSVVCYKSGRFDVLYRGDLSPGDRPGDRTAVQVHIPVPEGMGWIGLIAAPLGPHLQGGDVCWRNFRAW